MGRTQSATGKPAVRAAHRAVSALRKGALGEAAWTDLLSTLELS
jgi:hypothetical protein